MRPRCFTVLAFLTAEFLVGALLGQQPVATPKPAVFPPINPGVARVDVVLNGLDGPATALATSEETGMIAVACEHGTIRCWTQDMSLGLRTGETTPLALEGHRGPITALAWQGEFLVSTAADQKLMIWQMPEARVLHTIALEGVVRALALSPDGKTLATGSDPGAIQLWDTAAGKPGAKLEGHTDWILGLAFSADGKQLASGGLDAIVRLWDVAGAKKKLEIAATPPPQPNNPPPPPNRVSALAFSPDGGQLVFGGSDAQIYQAQTADGKIIRAIAGHGSSISSLAFHPSATLLVSGSKDRTIRLWNPANGQALKTLEGHQSWVQGIAFIGKGTRLASAGADQTVRLWDLTEPPKK